MRKLFIPLLAVIALPTVLNAGNEKDLIVVTDLGEKIIIKESDIQVERDTKNKLITMINDRTEGHINSTKDCIANNNATRVISNTPFEGPGVVTQRVDENKYDWMYDATKGNLIRASGYKF